MGTADAVPGVSGGTVALLLGIYERLIAAISSITIDQVYNFLRGCKRIDKDKISKSLSEMEILFLLSLGSGIISAVVITARAVTVLAKSNPILLFGVFTGLITSSVIILYDSLNITTPKEILAAISGFIIAFTLSGIDFSYATTSHFSTFIVGGIAISAMILPGISGSLFLIIFGKYIYLSAELTAFLTAVLQVPFGEPFQNIVDPGVTVGIFLSGGVVGLLTFSRLVQTALKNERKVTLTFLISLIAGSVRAPIVELNSYVSGWTIPVIFMFISWTVVGMTIVLIIDYIPIEQDGNKLKV